MSQPSISLSSLLTIKAEVERQYHDSSNLNARAAIYRFATNSISWPRWVFDQLSLPQNAQVLELGCGSGALWKQNLDRLPQQCRISLCDLSPGMLQECR